MKICFQHTKIGMIGIAENSHKISNCFFSTSILPRQQEVIESELIREAFLQLDAYLSGKLKKFSLPLAPEGTYFRQKVWQALTNIPYGQTASYKDIAESIGNPLASRAVGQANNKNPILLFIPCHRVIGSNGKLTGYSGGLDIKMKLLALEKHHGTF
jgi:methylated-DNA-[protein]-cysteine S-methyltransferase